MPKRLLTTYVDLVIVENDRKIPIPVSDLARIIRVADEMELVREIKNHQESARMMVVADSPISFDIARAFNRIPGHPMALYHDGTWDDSEILAELERLNNLLVDERENEHYIASQLNAYVYQTESGQIIFTRETNVRWDYIPVYKKKDHSEWGYLLTGKAFSSRNLNGTAIETASSIPAAVCILSSILEELMQMNDDSDAFPVLDSTLVFQKKYCLISEWTRVPDRADAFTKLCFRLLFGRTCDRISDASALILQADICHQKHSSFISDLERIYLYGEPCSLRKWEVILMRFQIDEEE